MQDIKVKNEKPFVLPFFTPATGKKPKPLAILTDDVVQITTFKRAEDNNDLIIRLFEPTGKGKKTSLKLPWLNKRISLSLGGFEIKTLRVNPHSGKIREVDLLERPLKSR